MQLYRPYLLGSSCTITIIYDHSAVHGLLKPKQSSGILARWIEILSEYDLEIRYRPGRVNEARIISLVLNTEPRKTTKNQKH